LSRELLLPTNALLLDRDRGKTGEDTIGAADGGLNGFLL